MMIMIPIRVLSECQKYTGIKLQDVCQYKDKKHPKNKVKKKNFNIRNQNRPQGLKIEHGSDADIRLISRCFHN